MFVIGNERPGFPNRDQQDDADTLRDAVIAMLGQVQGEYEPDDSEAADELISNLEELLADGFAADGELDSDKMRALEAKGNAVAVAMGFWLREDTLSVAFLIDNSWLFWMH